MDRLFPYLLALLIIGLTALAVGQDAASPDDDGVLLRYRLKPGDAQVYTADMRLDMKIGASHDGMDQDATTTMAVKLPFSVRGIAPKTGTADDGTMRAEVRFHGFDMNMDMTAAGQRMAVRADQDGLEVKQNGSVVMSGEWGEGQLNQFPDLGQLLDMKLTARFTDRGELIELGGLDGLAGQLQGVDFNQALNNQIVYPEAAVKPGDSWTHELTQDFTNAALPGGAMSLEATVTYTVLDRVTHRNRDCLKIRLEGEFSTPDPRVSMQLEQTVTGTAYVDIGTGVPLDCRLQIRQRIQGTVQGTELDMNSSGTVAVSYVGGKRKFAELTRDAEAASSAAALEALAVPMVTGSRIKINGKQYTAGDVVAVDGDEYRIVAFRPTALKLRRLSDSAVYQLGLGSGGHILYVKLLGYAD